MLRVSEQEKFSNSLDEHDIQDPVQLTIGTKKNNSDEIFL